MIHVKRTQIPAVLEGENSKGGKEYARWYKYKDDLKHGIPTKKPGEFSAYADESVKLALIAMFHKKCAYCDRSTTVGDVEHWRPKNAISSEDNKKVADGYWWLAARWENLLFSCMECNQRRFRELDDQQGLSIAGKGTQFPLKYETKRAKDVGKEIDETPLLLNPCDDDPEKFMTIAVTGKEKGVLQPKLDSDNKPDQRADASIKIFGLNEVTYVQRRIQLLDDLQNLMEDLKDLFASLPEDLTTPQADDIFRKINRKLTKLKPYLKDEQQDMLLIHQVLVPYLKGLGLEIG